MRSRALRSDRGFSMLELGITCLVVGVLTAIAVPAFDGAIKEGYHEQVRADLAHAALRMEMMRGVDGVYPSLSALAATAQLGEGTELHLSPAAAGFCLEGFHRNDPDSWFSIRSGSGGSGGVTGRTAAAGRC